MWQSVGYILIITAFVSVFCATATGRKRRMNLLLFIVLIAVLVLTFGGHEFVLFTCQWLFAFSLADFLVRLWCRRRIIPPCVKIARFTQGLWLLIIGLLQLILSALLYQAELTDIAVTPASLLLVAVAGILGVWYLQPEICTNGLWYGGTLYEWNDYDSFSWTVKGDKIVVDIYSSHELRTVFPKRILVPRGSWEAAKQLLEANLLNSPREEEGV
ncbi:MAG: hypothetical protein V2B18_17865 [Pseudomonadota bacterium]